MLWGWFVKWLANGAFWVAGLALFTQGCGYHVSGHGDLVPKSIHTIAVPPFTNLTVRYKVTDSLAEALSREFIARTHYQVIPDASQADAILKGAVVRYVAYPVLADQKTGRAAAVQIILTLQVSLYERETGKILFTRPAFDVRQRYEISIDQRAYFDESASGLQRLSGDVARGVVSAILEDF
jgi:hypothetical protein